MKSLQANCFEILDVHDTQLLWCFLFYYAVLTKTIQYIVISEVAPDFLLRLADVERIVSPYRLNLIHCSQNKRTTGAKSKVEREREEMLIITTDYYFRHVYLLLTCHVILPRLGG